MVRYGLGLAGAVFVLDQVVKFLVLGALGFSPPGCREAGVGCGFIELSGVFDLRMVWNHGVSFGMLRADSDIGRWVLVAVQLGIAGVFGSQLPGAARKLSAGALGLIIGGAVGNVIDRVRFGAVADFLDFSGLWFPWVFNVADAAITVGASLFFVDLVFFAEAEPGKGTMWQGLKRLLTAPPSAKS
jgi:signal peptidase II